MLQTIINRIIVRGFCLLKKLLAAIIKSLKHFKNYRVRFSFKNYEAKNRAVKRESQLRKDTGSFMKIID